MLPTVTLRISCAIALGLCLSPALATTVGGVQLQPALKSKAGSLVLATCGAKKTIVTHYVSALYVPRTGSIQAIGDPKAGKVVQVHITDDKFLPGEVPSKWRNALARAVPPQTLDTLDSMMKELRRGDLVAVTYAPKDGTVVTKNGQFVVRAAGHRPIDEILKTWARDAPIATKLDKLVAENPCQAK